jgi:fructose-1,6-bisphosphatase/inositol monophosphatase family enzyme
LNSTPENPERAAAWQPRLADLAERVRVAARAAMEEALRTDSLGDVYRTVGQGAGDATFGLDLATERAVDLWFEETCATCCLSLFTEDAGWRHRGPQGPLQGFDHGGPRVVIDPVDGTRNLMMDLRSAWTVIGLAGPGPDQPRQGEVELGIVAELPDSRARAWRILSAVRGGGCRLAVDGEERTLEVDGDARLDHGYFPFFGFHPQVRPLVARLGADVFSRLEAEGIDTGTCFDDQYISSGGQLALIALGTYRMVVEPRGWIAARTAPTQTCKPYDVAGAVLCATEAGALVTDLSGGLLDHPLDASTPVSFCAFHNRATRERLWPHLEAALEAFS